MYNKETKQYEGYIYEIYNKLNEQSYIGQTTQTVEKRWKRHIQTSKRELEIYFYNDLRLYGECSFIVYTIDTVSCESLEELHDKLNELEKYYIDKYNTLLPNGYNISIGGSNPPISRKGNVYQFDFKGNLLNTYKDTVEAASAVDTSCTNICSCCIGVLKSVKGYHWSRDIVPKKSVIDYLTSLIVVQYDFDGNKLKEYNTSKDAKMATGISSGDISACCRGVQLSAGGYVWRHFLDDFNKYRTPNERKSNKKPVRCVENGLIFDSVTAASEYCGVTASYMSVVCSENICVNGLHFELYYEDYLKECNKEVVA